MNNKTKKRLLWFIIIFILIIFIDQATKFWVDKSMYIYQSKNIINDWVRITYIQNEGFLMGFASHLNDGRTFNPIVLITIGALIVVIVYFIYLIVCTKTNDYLVITFSILLGGAFGNFIDRIVRKTVIDFIEFKFFHFKIGNFTVSSFPVFNFADFFVTTGIIMLIIYFLFLEKKHIPQVSEETIQDTFEDKIENLENKIEDKDLNI